MGDMTNYEHEVMNNDISKNLSTYHFKEMCEYGTNTTLEEADSHKLVTIKGAKQWLIE